MLIAHALLAQTYSSGSSFRVSPLGLGFGLIGFAFSVFVLVDVLRRPEAQWSAAGQNRGLWIGLGILGLFCCGLIIGLVYLLAIRPKLESAGTGGAFMAGGYPPQGYPPPGYPPQGQPGYPPQGYPPPPAPGAPPSYPPQGQPGYPPPPPPGGFPPPPAPPGQAPTWPPPADPPAGGSGWPPPPPAT